MGFAITGPEKTFASRAIKATWTERCIYNVLITDEPDTAINNYDETGATTVIDLEAVRGDATADYPVGGVVFLFVESGSGFEGRGVVQSSVFGTPHAGITTITFTELFGIGSTSVIDTDDYIYWLYARESRTWQLRQAPAATVNLTELLYVHPKETGLIEIDVGKVAEDYLIANSLNFLWFSFVFSESSSGAVFGTDHLIIQGRPGPFTGRAGSATFPGENPYHFVIHTVVPGDGSDPGARPLSRFWQFVSALDQPGDRDGAFWWEGWTTTVSYLFDEDTAGVTVYIQQNDIFPSAAPAARSTLETITVASTDPQVFEKNIATPTATATFIETYFSDTLTRTSASQKVVWRIVRDANQPDNPMMIKWRNTFGGFSHWLFGICGEDETNEYNITGKGTYQKFQGNEFYDMPLGNVLELDYKKIVQKITVQTNYVTYLQLLAIKEILISNEVYIYTLKDGNANVRVTIDPQPLIIEYSGKASKTLEEGSQANVLKDPNGTYGIQILVTFPAGFDYHRDTALD